MTWTEQWKGGRVMSKEHVPSEPIPWNWPVPLNISVEAVIYRGFTVVTGLDTIDHDWSLIIKDGSHRTFRSFRDHSEKVGVMAASFSTRGRANGCGMVFVDKHLDEGMTPSQFYENEEAKHH